MKKKILIFFVLFFGVFWGFSYAENWDCEDWIRLNTNVPFIGNCIWWEDSEVDEENAFPILMWWMSKILITLTLVIAFLMLVAGGVLITTSGADQANYSKWKELIIKVLIWIFLLWASWVILHMINPNFFT